MKKFVIFILTLAMICSVSSTALAASVKIDTDIEMLDAAELKAEWKQDQDFTLADPAPWNLEELKQVVDVKDPRSVAAYFAWAVTRMTDNYNDGMEMMKYLFADIEPFGRGFTEGGMSGKAGWDSYMNDRLKSTDYGWLPGAYFEGAESSNGFRPERPLTLELYYNNTNTETINAQTLEQLGRLNIVYWIKSHAAGNQVNINVSKFDESDRWYVTSGTTSTAMFYDQRAGLTNTAKTAMASNPLDSSTPEEHAARYGSAADVTEPAPKADEDKDKDKDNDKDKGKEKDDVISLPFTDVDANSIFAAPVKWAFEEGVTAGMSDTLFGTYSTCTRGQVVTFLWRAAGQPEPNSSYSPFIDVNYGDYFYDAVLWAVEQGITSGTSANTFSPNETCSSAHIITFLYRALGIGTNGWYQEAKNWAAMSNMLSGTGMAVNPDELCPRGAVAVFLYRAYNK